MAQRPQVGPSVWSPTRTAACWRRCSCSHLSDFVAVKVDLANAFNECTRAAMLSAVARSPAFAGLLPMYAATLSVASPLYMTGENGQLEKIRSDCQEGGHQGCASTSAAFCLAIHPSVVAADAALEAVGGCARFFADDGYLIGPPDAVLTALDTFATQVNAECGLRLNVSKTEFYARSPAARGPRAEGGHGRGGATRHYRRGNTSGGNGVRGSLRAPQD